MIGIIISAVSSAAMDSVEDSQTDGRFEYNHLYQYLQDGTYPEGFTKADKSGLRKRAKFFTSQGSELYYTGNKLSK